jgi:glutamine amidotransferase
MSGGNTVIVDYRLGNLFSVERALHKIGASNTLISNDKKVIENADRLIIPGVGAYGDGMNNLRELGIIDTIKTYAASGRPVLGVCLGMQMMMSESNEFGRNEGLGLVSGKVTRLETYGDARIKVPHIGWNTLSPAESPENLWSGSVLQGLEDGSHMYFLHSHIAVPDDFSVALATTTYGDNVYCSAFKQGNLTGVQFHPERSGKEGLSIYASFVKET